MDHPHAIANMSVVGLTILLTYLAFRNPALLQRCLFSSTGILARRQYDRLLLSGFVHANWPHLFFNMFSLYSFGSYMEMLFGPVIFLLIYFASMLGGGLLALYLHRHHEYRAVGASGGVCGVIFASIFLLPGSSVYLMFIPIPIPSWLYAIIFIAVSVRGIHAQTGSIGHEAHLGGALAGLAVTTAIWPLIVVQSPLLFGVVVTMVVGFLIYFAKHPSDIRIKAAGPRPAHDHRPSGITTEDEHFIETLRHKIAEHGMNALTPEEKRKLHDLSQDRRPDTR